MLELKRGYGLISYGVVCRLLTYHANLPSGGVATTHYGAAADYNRKTPGVKTQTSA